VFVVDTFEVYLMKSANLKSSGECLLKVTDESIQLLDIDNPRRVQLSWPLSGIRRYTVERGMFSIEAGRSLTISCCRHFKTKKATKTCCLYFVTKLLLIVGNWQTVRRSTYFDCCYIKATKRGHYKCIGPILYIRRLYTLLI